MAEDDRQNKFIFKEVLRNLKAGQALQRQAQQTVSAVGGHVREVLGPFTQVTDFMKSTFTNIGGFVKGLAQDLGLFGKKSAEEVELEKQTGFLEGILNTLIGQEKEEFREGLGKKTMKKGWGLVALALGFLAFQIGALAGGFLKALWIPFKLIFKFFRGLAKRIPIFGTMFEKGIKALRSMFLRLPKSKFVQDIIVRVWMFFATLREWFGKTRVARLFKGVGGFFLRIGRFFTRFRGLLVVFRPVAAVFDKFLLGFKKGFKYLGWPILILLSIIDFIKGFVSTEGDILTKIEKGISEVVKGFFELPVRVFGWVAEKIWGFITGTKIEGGTYAKEMFSFIDKIIEGVFHPWGILLEGVQKFTGWFTGMWNSLMDSLIPLVKKIPLVGGKMAEGLEAIKFDVPDEVDVALQQKSKVESAADARKDKTAHELLDINKELSKNMKGVQESQAQAGANIVTAVSTKKEKDVQEPPSGIEEAATIWLNLAM
jgi:hypothetical protein